MKKIIKKWRLSQLTALFIIVYFYRPTHFSTEITVQNHCFQIESDGR